MSDRELTWAITDNSKRVHLYVNGIRQCLSGYHGSPQPISMKFPEWDPADEHTCHKCRERYFWLNKGGVPVSVSAESK